MTFRYFFALLLSLASFSSLATAAKDAEFYTLLEEIWQYELSVSPLLASRHGDHSLAAQLPDISPEALARKHGMWVQYRNALEKYNVDNLSNDGFIALLMQKYR